MIPRSPGSMLVAEFPDAEALCKAAKALRDGGYRKYDAHSPYPIAALKEAMALPGSPLPYLVLAAGLITFFGFMAFMAWASLDYPLVHSGKAALTPALLIPAAIEVTWIGAGTVCLLGFIALAGMPLYYHLVFKSPNFLRASDDAFFITVEEGDPAFDAQRTRALLESLGGKVEHLVEEETRSEGEGKP